MPNDFATMRLRPFFEAFQAKNAAGDVDALAVLYAPTILVATPTGTSVVPFSALRAAAHHRRQLLDALGIPNARLVTVSGMALDDRYALARTEWLFSLPSKAADVTLASTFIIERIDSAEPRIIVYMNHQDLLAVLRDHGLHVD